LVDFFTLTFIFLCSITFCISHPVFYHRSQSCFTFFTHFHPTSDT
jgi:hypothetical protein